MHDPAPTATHVARLACPEAIARRLAAALGETLDTEDAACAAFEDGDGRWQVAIHFRTAPAEDALRTLVCLTAGEAAAAALTVEPLAAADWVAQSLAGLPPVRAGRFLVHGAHDRARVRPNDLAIEIEASLAFGTGHHGTTRGCLLALDRLAKRVEHARNTSHRHPEVRAKRASKGDGRSSFEGRLRRPPQDDGARLSTKRILDLGTGTGVLAIAAAKRLAARVTASDIDPLAVNAARDNARRNGVPGIAFVHAAGIRGDVVQAAPYDLIFANILLGPLVRLAAPLTRLAAPDAHVVLSGLLPAHANAALAAYRAQGLALERRIPLDGWVTLVLRRR